LSLTNPVFDWFGARSERVIETACARVYLSGDTAYKLKQPLDFGYADFSTLERRKWALDRELAFNRASAPDIYRAVHAVTRAGSAFELNGPGEVVDHVLEMRRFADDAVLGARLASVDGTMAEGLGRTIAGSHAAAPLRPQGGINALMFTIGSNAELLRDLAPRLGEDRVTRLLDLADAELERQRPLLTTRTAEGFARRCHGDLHLGNILVEEGRTIPFDCIEFNDLLSDIDVQYDLAFLLMDLDFRGRRDAGVRVLSAWLDQAARHFPESLRPGLTALPLMLSVRAGVRAHVEAWSGDDAAAIAFVEAGIAHLSPAPPSLTAVGGLSGTGKSTVARAIAPALGASPGAVILRTDEIRKRLLGVDATDPLEAAAYTSAIDARVYGALADEALALLVAGRSVVLDATFLDPMRRAEAEAIAVKAGVPFEGLWLEAPVQVLRDRVAARRDDASDATVATLEGQLVRDVGAMDWRRLDVSGSVDATVSRWTAGRRA
jgi:aminoglycoside phosphotransferase family enzyme/predicted kinase